MHKTYVDIVCQKCTQFKWITSTCNYPYFFIATLEIISVGAGLVKMLGIEAELFVTIDDSGVLRATVSHSFLIRTISTNKSFVKTTFASRHRSNEKII